MKRIANRSKAIVLVPLVLKPTEVQVALGVIPVEVRNVPIAVRVLPDRANVQNIF